MKALYFIFPIVILSCFSCSVYRSGHVSSGPLLSIKDKYVGVACGEVTAKVQGLKDYSRELLIMDAKMNMFKNRPLKKGEYYANFILNVEIREEFHFFFAQSNINIAVCADVMSQNSQNDSLPFSPEFRELVNTVSRQNLSALNDNGNISGQNSFTVDGNVFKLNDTIYINMSEEDDEYSAVEIITIGDKMANLRYLNRPRPNKIIDYSNYEIYSTSKISNGYGKGDKVKIISALNSDRSISGIVLATNGKKIIVSSEYGIHPYMPERLKK